MKRLLPLILCFFTLLILSSCGYHLGGTVNAKLKGVKTIAVTMFDNNSEYPDLGFQVTTAMGNALQTDGTFTMAPPSSADVIVSGSVSGVDVRRSLIDGRDTHLARELTMKVYVSYTITRRKDGKVLVKGRANGDGSYFNTGGNTQAGRAAALSYASRRAAGMVVDLLTRP